MEESLEIRLQQITISDFHFNYVAVKEAIEFKRANDPAFKHISMATIAKKLGLGESTYKKVLCRNYQIALCISGASVLSGLGTGASPD